MYFRQVWQDERLSFENSSVEQEELVISQDMLDKIWWPDTFFANAKQAKFHEATTKNAFLRIKPSGLMTQSLRFALKYEKNTRSSAFVSCESTLSLLVH